MRTSLFAGIGSGLVMSLFVVGGLSMSLGTAAPAGAAVAPANDGPVALCHLQEKVDPDLLFNDGRVVTPNKASCIAHCKHGDQPMPVPADNNAHPNRQCARVHVVDGLPSCEVNTPATALCSVENCIARCEAS